MRKVRAHYNHLVKNGGALKIVEGLLEKLLGRIFRSWDEVKTPFPQRMKIVPPFVYDILLFILAIIILNQMLFWIIKFIKY